MKRNEEKFLETLTNKVDSNNDFEQLRDKIDYKKYQKSRKVFSFTPKLKLAFSTFLAVIVVVLVIILIPENPNNNRNDSIMDESSNVENNSNPGNPESSAPESGKDDENTKTDNGDIESEEDKDHMQDVPGGSNGGEGIFSTYEGFIKEHFESNMKFSPDSEASGPMPLPPVIDELFYTSDDQSYIPIEEIGMGVSYLHKYLYEVETKTINSEYIAVYIDKDLANKISIECEEVMDVTGASPLENIDGSVVDWFYTHRYYDKDKVYWMSFMDPYSIKREEGKFICVGVFLEKQRTITRNLLTGEIVGLSENVFSPSFYKYDSKENKNFIIPVNLNNESKITWHMTSENITTSNTFYIFNSVYSSKINASIDLSNNTITLTTFAVQDETLLSINYCPTLKEYHLASNELIVENKKQNDRLGKTTNITYKYNELVLLLQR